MKSQEVSDAYRILGDEERRPPVFSPVLVLSLLLPCCLNVNEAFSRCFGVGVAVSRSLCSDVSILASNGMLSLVGLGTCSSFPRIVRLPFWIKPSRPEPNWQDRKSVAILAQALEDPVQLFRTRFCLQDVRDFAAAFVSWEEASRMAGPAVANAWAATAAVPEEVTELFAVEQAVLAGRSVGAGGPRQRCQRPAQLLLRARPRQPKVRPPAAATDQVSDRLAYFFERAGAHRPVSCPEARQREWRTFLSQVAARKVSAAEPATIDRVLRTIEELERWQLSRGRADGLSDCDSVDLSAFLTEGTTAPARALSALRWFAKHGRLGWDFSELVLGKRPGYQVSARGQAIPAEPFMPSLLEQKMSLVISKGMRVGRPS